MSNRSLAGPADLFDMKREWQIQFLKSQGLKPEHSLLDVGCGNLRGGIPIIEYLDVFNYMGVDSRNIAIVEGYSELYEHNLDKKHPNLQLTDDFSFLLDHQFDFIWCFSVLIHMNDRILKDFFRNAQNMVDRCKIYANVNIGDRHTGNWKGFPVQFKSYDFYEDLINSYGFNVENLGTLLELGHCSYNDLGDSQVMLKIGR